MEITSNVISLFNFAVSCFDRIQLAREFEDDFETYQLKLDILQIRLSRWGEAAGITANTNKAIESKDSDSDAKPVNDAERLLSGIQDVLIKAQRKAKGMNVASNSQTLDSEQCMPEDLKKIRMRFQIFIRRRRVQAAKVADEAKWAFYKRDNFERVVTSISALLSELERLFPEDTRQKLHTLSSEECKGISQSNLEELKEIAEDCDPWLERAADEELKNVSGTGTNITMSHNKNSFLTGIHYGSNYGVTSDGDIIGFSTGTNSRIANSGRRVGAIASRGRT